MGLFLGDFEHFIVFFHDGADGPDHIVGQATLPNVNDLFDHLTEFTSTIAPKLGLKHEECRMVQMDRMTLMMVFFPDGEPDVS